MHENGEQGMSSHVIRPPSYFKVSDHMNSHAMEDVTDGSLRMNKHDDDDDDDDDKGNKHSYFLRAKTRTRRFVRHYWASDEDIVEFKKSSSVGKNHVPSPSLSSPGYKFGRLDDDYSVSIEEEDLANCLVMLSANVKSARNEETIPDKAVEKGVFQCKACKKIFNSHQALGGHRASHKKVKGCFASKSDGGVIDIADEDVDQDFSTQQEREPNQTRTTYATSSTRKRTNTHECSVCHRVFSSGQALGGHKRCHWMTTSADNAFVPTFQYHDDDDHNRNHQITKKPMFVNPHDDTDQNHELDLNLSASQHENHVSNNTIKAEISTRINVQRQLATTNSNHREISNTGNDKSEKGCDQMDKVPTLSDLRDVSYDEGWLQMGIAPSTADIY